MITLIHSGAEWLFAGIIVFIGIVVFGAKLMRGNLMGVALGVLVWWFVYSMHKGSTAGIMTATLAALLFDLFGLGLIKLFSRR